MEDNFVSVVCYIYNNEAAIDDFLTRIHRLLESHFKHFEVICVDDRSSDGSCDAIRRFAAEGSKKQITLVRLSYHQQVERALEAGIDLAIGDFIFEFDSLLMDWPEDILFEAYQTALRGHDLVSVVPDRVGSISSKVFYFIFNRVSKIPNALHTKRFWVISRRAVNRINGMYDVIPWRKAIYADIGLPSTVILYESFHPRIHNRFDRREWRNRMNTAINAFILFSDVAYKWTFYAAGMMLMACICLGVYSLAILLSGITVFPGWTTFMVSLSIISCFIALMFAIVLKYLSILTAIAVGKKRYVVHSMEKL